uniref:Uncharacterized protein n=1 Tax=Penaeus semisulcatus majanivirus TaxID=2984274 RepID=A0A9C7EYE7_9VIRU|nr:MAG: hypothetical protein [Penaeus semisulcatus majanivirus]
MMMHTNVTFVVSVGCFIVFVLLLYILGIRYIKNSYERTLTGYKDEVADFRNVMADYKTMAKQMWRSAKTADGSHRCLFIIDTDSSGTEMKPKKCSYRLRDKKFTFKSTYQEPVKISKISSIADIESIVNDHQPIVRQPAPNSGRHQQGIVITTYISNIYDVTDLYASKYNEFIVEIVIDQHVSIDKRGQESANMALSLPIDLMGIWIKESSDRREGDREKESGNIDVSGESNHIAHNTNANGNSIGNGSSSSSRGTIIESGNSNGGKKWIVSTAYAQGSSKDGKGNSMQFTLSDRKIDITPTAATQNKIFLNVRQEKNPNNSIEGSWTLCLLFEEV